MRTAVTIIIGLVIGAIAFAWFWRSPEPGDPGPGGSLVAPTDEPADRRRTGVVVATRPVPEGVDPDAIGEAFPASLSGSIRIVSLSPAMSRILVDAGLEAAIVGRSRFCTFLDPEIPVAGDLIRIDAERLIALRPTHVLRQPPSRDDSAALTRLAREQEWAEPILARLDRIDDVRAFVRRLPRQLAPRDSSLEAALIARVAAIETAMERLLAPVPAAAQADRRGAESDSVLLLTGIRPPTAFGRRTYLDELLAARGGRNAFQGEGWRSLSAEDLVRLAPDAIVLVTDRPEDAEAILTEARSTWSELGLAAVDQDRVSVLAHPEVMRPSTGLLQVGPAFAAALAQVGAGDPGRNTETSSPAGGVIGAGDAGVAPDRPGTVPPVPLPGDLVGPAGAGDGS